MTRFSLLSLLLAVLVALPAAAQSGTDTALLAEAGVKRAPSTAPAAVNPPVAQHAHLLRELPRPSYPARGRQFGTEGQVRVAYTVDERGRTRDAEIVEGLGRDFDREALRVIRKARFEPALGPGGQPVAVRYETTFIFRLDEER